MTGSRSLSVVVGRLTTPPAPEGAESGVGGLELPDLAMATYLPYASYGLVLLGVCPQGWPLLHSVLMHHKLLLVGEHCDPVIAAIKASTEHTRGAVSATAVDPERPDVSGFCCSWGAERFYVMHVQRPACNWLSWPCRVQEIRRGVYVYETPWVTRWFYGLRKERDEQAW